MEERFLGEIIREKRLEQGLSLEELSEGICDVSTLSRLETGKQSPTRHKLNRLLQKLGISDDRYFAYVNKEEIELNSLFKDITALNILYENMGRDPKIREELVCKQEELISIIDEDDNVAKQFLAISQMITSEESIEEKIQNLISVIKLTQPKFDEKQIRKGLFSFDEVKLINLLAVSYSDLGNHEKAIYILEQLLKNIDDRFELIIPSVSHKTLILYSLARELLIVEDNKRAQEYAEEGRKLAIKYSAYLKLPGYLMILAECEHRNGNDDKCKELLKETYYLCKIIGDDANGKIIEDGFMEYYGVKI